MKLPIKSEYACLTLIDLTQHYKKGYVKIEEISNRKNIPKKYLRQILLLLKNGGYIKTGSNGEGRYRLIKNPGKITVAEIVKLMDGALAAVGWVGKYFYEETPVEQHEPLLNFFIDIRNYIAIKMETTNFADLV